MPHEQLAQQLMAALRQQAAPADATEPVIEIHGTLRHLTAFYERIRTLIDYQEERFIRRLAVRRILFRRILIERQREQIGEPLLRELIRAAYLENGKIPVSTALAIDAILKKYLDAIPTIEQRYQPRDIIRMERRLLGIAAAEVEDFLYPSVVDQLLTDRLAHELNDYIKDETVSDRTRIIALRAFLKADAELIAWRLLQLPNNALWGQFTTEPAHHASELIHFILKIDIALREPQLEADIRRYGRLVPPYIILADLVHQQAAQLPRLHEQPDRLEETLENLIHERIGRSESKIHRQMTRATVYIFLTKVLIGIALEVPYDQATQGHISWLPLTLNILIPPLLLITAALGIRPPSSANNDLVLKRAKTIFFGGQLPPLLDADASSGRDASSTSFFSFLLFILYILIFGGLIWILASLEFNIMAIAIFLFFLSVVGFFAFRIRNSAKELAMIREKEGVMLLVFDFLALPFLRLGRRLAMTVSQANVVLFVLDFIIEAPLKVVFVAIEDWFAFLREKREELR